MLTDQVAPACPVDETFDPLSSDFLADPFAVLARLSTSEVPIFYAPSIGYYVLTRYADIEQVFRDSRSYSAAVAQAPLVPLAPRARVILLADPHRPHPSMLTMDEPGHSRLRKPPARAFSATRIHPLIPGLTDTA